MPIRLKRSMFLSAQLLAALLGVALCAAAAFPANRMYCYQDVLHHRVTGKAQMRVTGFLVEVGPSHDPDDPSQTTCRGVITSPQGKVVFEQSDWGMEIDPVTGKDVNGDGQPDAVLIEFSGGAHCCWTYYIISLGKAPGLIREFQNRDTASFRDLRGDGHIEIVLRDGSFDFGFGLDHAFSVFPLLIVRLKGTTFEDVGSAFWPVFEKEIAQQREKLNATALTRFLRSNPSTPEGNLDHQQTQSAVLLIVLDELYGGRYADAHSTLQRLWPSGYQQDAWEEILAGYCEGLRSDLKVNAGSPCAALRVPPGR